MDNEYTYQEKEKSINNAFENKQINDYLQENEHMEAGYNMMEQKVDIYDQMANIQKTSQDVANISGILERMNLGTYEVEEKEVKIAKLEAIQGRMLSHLMLNDQKVTGDSEEMDKVKNRLHELEVAMTAEQRHALGDKQIDYLQNLYEGAIEACRLYCKTKHPWLPAGKRRKAKVKATLARLMRESDCLELGRMIVNREGSEAASINSGLKLLSLTAVQNLADKMEGSKRRHNLRNKLEEDMQNLEKKSAEDEKNLAPDYMKYNEAMFLHDTKKATYDEAKKAYDELYERKEKVEKIGWFKLKFGGDEELDNAHANLKLLENEVDNAEEAVNDQLEKIKNFEKMHQDNSAKKEKQKKNIFGMRSSIIDTISDGSNFSGLTTRYTDAETLQDVFNPICWQNAENRMNDYANEEKSQKLINVNILEKLSQEADWELFIERMCKDALVLVERDGVETDADQILTSMVQLGLPRFENQAFRTKVEEKVRGIFNGEGYNNV